MKATPEALKDICNQVRRDILRMTHGASSGHPGGSLGCVEFMTLLYFEWMHTSSTFQMKGTDEDLFFLSNGHISPVWYSVLARKGFFPISELNTFRKINSRLQGHPATAEHLPGVRVASGSLGQGLSVAIGAALGKRLHGEAGIVYCLMGDGEQQEGQIWEAAMFAAHHKVDRLIAFIDWNGQQIDGPNDQVIGLGDLKAKYTAFGWEVIDADGNDLSALHRSWENAIAKIGQGKPILVRMKTIMGKGVDFMENDYRWHGVAPNDAQLSEALRQLPETLGDYPA